MQATSNPHIYYKFFIMKTTAVFFIWSLLSKCRDIVRVIGRLAFLELKAELYA